MYEYTVKSILLLQVTCSKSKYPYSNGGGKENTRADGFCSLGTRKIMEPNKNICTCMGLMPTDCWIAFASRKGEMGKEVRRYQLYQNL